jgi:hypothetical protein
MSMGAIAAASAAHAAWGIKLALTLLAESDRSLSGSGAPAAPRPPLSPIAPLAPGLDFPALIAVRFAMTPRPPRSRPSDSDRRSRKKN